MAPVMVEKTNGFDRIKEIAVEKTDGFDYMARAYVETGVGKDDYVLVFQRGRNPYSMAVDGRNIKMWEVSRTASGIAFTEVASVPVTVQAGTTFREIGAACLHQNQIWAATAQPIGFTRNLVTLPTVGLNAEYTWARSGGGVAQPLTLFSDGTTIRSIKAQTQGGRSTGRFILTSPAGSSTGGSVIQGFVAGFSPGGSMWVDGTLYVVGDNRGGVDVYRMSANFLQATRLGIVASGVPAIIIESGFRIGNKIYAIVNLPVVQRSVYEITIAGDAATFEKLSGTVPDEIYASFNLD